MAVKIISVEEKSPAAMAGVNASDTLVSINGNPIRDVLDFRFRETERELSLELADESGETRFVRVHKGQYEPLGLGFETWLMDKQRACRNNCVFCFIDQLPCGLRDTLYFKDDDDRLSFLFGNYITLTNIGDDEIERIIEMHISPINISVHSMEPEVRVKMMRNRFAGEALGKLRRLAQAGVELNCQLVLCPGMNDGEHLRITLDELFKLMPAVRSVALVPVGLTKHRDGLYPLRLFTPEECAQIVRTAEEYAHICYAHFGSRVVHAADEIYLKAGIPLPDEEYYEDFAQLENGVGLVTLLRSEFEYAVEQREGDDIERHLTLATGVSAAPILRQMLDDARKKWHNLYCDVVAIRNDFFGENITVAGLVTGGDLIGQLSSRDLHERLLIPRAMLRREGDLFLDDVSLEQVQEALQVPVVTVENEGEALLDALLGSVNY